MRMRGVLSAGLLGLAAVGCANARYIQKDVNGGVIAMPADSRSNRKKADELMREHVGPGYVVVEEKEVVTGQETTNHSDTQNELGLHSTVPVLPANKQITTTTTTTRDLTEWHIVYRRGGLPPAVADSPVQQTGGRK